MAPHRTLKILISMTSIVSTGMTISTTCKVVLRPFVS